MKLFLLSQKIEIRNVVTQNIDYIGCNEHLFFDSSTGVEKSSASATYRQLAGPAVPVQSV